MSTPGATSSSVSSLTPRWKYDVFLSFRGEDTRNNFTDHLYAALQRKGIVTFRDEEGLEKGESISPALLKAIEESRFAIIILSKNYVSSSWCMEELAKMVRCRKETGLTILPIFYHVSPSDVRKQAKTIYKHNSSDMILKEGTLFRDMMQLFVRTITLEAALREVANISGWHLQDSHESEYIQDIVDVILQKLSSSFSSNTNNLVGIDSSVEELITLYHDCGNKVCMTGICGMGGLGKTTLARVVYDKFCSHFEGSSFIANVREESEKYGLLQLQKKLLADIMEDGNIDIRDVYQGVDMIKKRLRIKKVLLVLDDVNQIDQLEKLCGEYGWFGLESWIIITTRDEHLLVQHEVHKIFKPNSLNSDVALKLLCLKAFKNEQPKEGYMQLSQECVRYANGLPLALVTLGSFLAGRTMDEWQSALESFKKIPKREIFDILRVSYDELEEMWKEIFLDIACFFRGKTKDRVVEILEKCGFYARISISVLIDKSLLTIENNKLCMHGLVQEMGKEIIRQESRGEPGKRSRLWLIEDLFHVLTKDTATEAIQAIVLNRHEWERGYREFETFPFYEWTVQYPNFEVFPEAFSKMCNLRLLIVDNLSISNGLHHLPNSLRFLDWFGYSSKCLPSSFHPKELVELNLRFSEIKYLWKGVKYLDMLKSMDLSYSANIIQTPDFTGFPRLERLRLSWCTNLVDLHPSIRQLSRLVVLDLEHCKSLTNLPCISTEMESLKILNLCGCPKIINFLEFNGVLKSLSELHLSGTGIETLPSSIDCLAALSLLNLKDCCHLECLPGYMDSLMSLEKLDISGCRRLVNLPDSLWKIKCLKELDLQGTRIIEVPSANRVWQDLLKYQLSWNRRSWVSRMYPTTMNSGIPDMERTADDSLELQGLPGYDDRSRRVAFTILNRYLQGLLCQKTEFQTIIEMNNLPQWLTHQSLGNSISIELPPNWCNGRWMGFVLCAYVNVIGETFGLGARVIALGDMPHSLYASKTFFRTTALGSHIWLLYFSRDDWFATVGNGECSQIEVVFENYGSVEGVMECGVSLVYEQDVEEFNQTIAQSGK